MAITYNGTDGPYSDVSIGSTYFPWSRAPAADDLLIAVMLIKPYNITPDPPPGWHTLGSIISGTEAMYGDGGSLSLSVFCKINSGSELPVYTPPGPPVSVLYYATYGYSKSAGSEWVVTATFGADSSTTSTTVAAGGSTAPLFRTGDQGLWISGQTSDGATIVSPLISISGCVTSTDTAITTVGTTYGNDLRYIMRQFSIVSGVAAGAPIVSTTAGVSGHSSVPMAWVRIGERIPTEHVAKIIDIAPTAPRANPLPMPVKTTFVGVSSPSATVTKSNAKTNTITVTSPAGTYSATFRYADMESELAVSTTTSGVLRAMSPAAAASLGMTAPVEVQIWKPNNSGMLAVIDGRMDMSWLDDLNDCGSGGFDISRWDPKATAQNMALFNLVRFVYAGETRFASRIEERQLTVSGNGDHEGQIWAIQGRGVLAMLADAALYPEYGVNEFTRKERGFFYGSREGAWYVPSEWFAPRGTVQGQVAATHPWHAHPADWPDAEAQWIWPTDPMQLANPGTVWFRSKFFLPAPMTVTVYASADDQVTLFVDGFPALATVAGESHSFRRSSQFSIKMAAGEHLIAAEVLNNDATLEEVQPIVVANEVRPTYVKDTNKFYLGSNVWDGQFPYVYSDGHVDHGGAGPAAFDGDPNSYWLSIGNYPFWSSAYDWVEGTFPSQTVTAVRVKMRRGPYNVYVSLKNGGNGWNGSSTVPYVTRKQGGWVDTGADIRYVREARVGNDAEVVINIPPQTADRIRVTLSAEWDSGLGEYRYRTAIYDVVVTHESREGSYIQGGNFAGLLVTVAQTDDSGAITGIVHRSQPSGWLCKTGNRPGWRPAHILTQIIAEAKARNILGVSPMSLGFDNNVDSYGNPWTLARKDVSYGVGDDYLSVVKKLVEDSEMDVWIEPDTLFLHAAPRRGADNTAPPNTVILRPGQSLTDFAVDSGRPQATRLLVESEYGWTEVADFEPESMYGRVEGFVSLGNALSIDEARDTARNELDQFAIESYDTTVRHTDVIGPKPYIDYNVGDRVLLPTAVGEERLVVNRVMSLKISEGDAGELEITIEADRQFDISDLAF